MKKLFVTFISALISISAISQDFQYRKDDRPQNSKEDPFNQYQAQFSEIDLQKVFEMLGVKKLFFQISPAFEKEYVLTIYLDEYVEGEKISSRNITKGKNTYLYPVDNPTKQERVMYIDYIPDLTVFTKENDTTVTLKMDYHKGGPTVNLNKKKNRGEWLTYHCRTYSKIDWKLNEEIPLLVYASPWWDESIKLYRFCTAPDLSIDEKVTKELYDNSPHYYVLGYKISE